MNNFNLKYWMRIKAILFVFVWLFGFSWSLMTNYKGRSNRNDVTHDASIEFVLYQMSPKTINNNRKMSII